MPRIDVDAQRAARREKRGDDPIVIVVAGQDFRLPDELPLDILEELGPLLDGKNITTAKPALRALVGDEAYDASDVPWSVQDLEELAEAVVTAYGLSTTPSSASSAT